MLDLLKKYPEHRDKNGRFWVFLYWREFEDERSLFNQVMYILGPDFIQYRLTDPDTILRTKRDIQNRQGKFIQSRDVKRTQIAKQRDFLEHYRQKKGKD